MNVLLTGSSGWLGRFLAPALQAEGHGVVGLDVVPGAATDVLGSVVADALVGRLFAGHRIDVVIHAAALHQPDLMRYPAHAFIDVNVRGTANLLDAAVGRRSKRSSSPPPRRS